MATLDIEKMAAHWLKTVGFDKPADDVARLAGFARTVALACARIAGDIGEYASMCDCKPYDRALRVGRRQAATAIRHAVARKGKGR